MTQLAEPRTQASFAEPGGPPPCDRSGGAGARAPDPRSADYWIPSKLATLSLWRPAALASSVSR